MRNVGNEDDRWVVGTCSMVWCSTHEVAKCQKIVTSGRKHIDFHAKVAARAGINLSWQFITMSSVNSASVVDAFDVEKKVWQRFRNTMAKTENHPWRVIWTWLGFREMTYNEGTGYNLHRHMLVAIPRGKKLVWRDVHNFWNHANGGIGHFHARIIQGKKNLSYALKYSRKGRRLYWGGLHQDIAYENRSDLSNRPRFIRMSGSKPPKETSSEYVLCCLGMGHGLCKKD